MVYHKNNYFIPRHRKYSEQLNQCDVRAAHDGKATCHAIEYTTAFLYSDWLYFLWHGINMYIGYCSLERSTYQDFSISAMSQANQLQAMETTCTW